MISKEVIVRCESGLHNNQATYFVQKALPYNAPATYAILFLKLQLIAAHIALSLAKTAPPASSSSVALAFMKTISLNVTLQSG